MGVAYLKTSVQSADWLDEDYVLGLRYADKEEWQSALHCFSLVMSRTDHFHTYFTLYSSAEGLAKVMQGDASGLNQCRQAVQDEPKRPDLYVNFARACLRLKQRKKAVDAVHMGLRVLPHHAALNQLKIEMGFRHRPVIPFLGRDNLINRILGRQLYRC